MSNKGRGTIQAADTSARAHRADIDGLRAVAILGVLAYHFGLGVPGGYGGVDVFFVISGFLIAGIIKSEVESGTFSLAQFYARRVRRILPALTVCMLVTSIVATKVLFSVDFVHFSKALVAVASATTNFVFIRQYANYFQESENPLLHTWSLSIEEQFYAFFPLIILLLYRYRKRALMPVMIVSAASSFAWSVYLVAQQPLVAFYSTPGRIWELLVGTLLAFGAIPQLRNRMVREIEAALGATMLLGSFFFYQAGIPFPGAAAVPLCLGAALIIHSGADPRRYEALSPTFVARALSLPPAVAVGVISYSVYLWHWPLLILARYRFPDAFASSQSFLLSLLLAALSLVLGGLSWRYVEQPFRGHLVPQLRGRTLAAGAATLIAIFAGGKWMVLDHASIQSWSPEVQAITDQIRFPLRPAEVGGRAVAGWPRETFEFGSGPEQPDTLLWGDSHALAILPGFIEYLAKANKRALVYAHSGCPPLMNVNFYGNQSSRPCRGLNDKILDAMVKSGIKRVVMEGIWEKLEGQTFEVSESSQGGAINYKPFATVFEATIRKLHDSGKEVVIIGPLPNQVFGGATTLARYLTWGTPLPAQETSEHFRQKNEDVLEQLARLEREGTIRVVYPDRWLCSDGGCPFLKDGVPLYLDHDHLSAAGSRQLLDMYAQFFPLTEASAASASN